MEKNRITRVEIIDTNENAVGVAKIDGAIIFVPGLVRGDTADINVTSQKKNYMTAECTSLVSKSENRITPVCDSSGECGGCTLCHVTYEHENEIKMNTVKSAFRRAGLPLDTVTETVFPKKRTEYRNKITLHFSKKENSFGLYREKTNDTLPFSGCHLIPASASRVIKFINTNISLIKTQGEISLEIRTTTRGTISVLFRTECCDITTMRNALSREFPEITDVNTAKPDTAKQIERHYVRDNILGLDLIFSTDGFRQVNDEAFAKMIDIISSFASEREFNVAFDLYCGSGVIGLALANRFKEAKFYGIEINPESIKDARLNAEANGIRNIDFFCGDAASIRTKLAEKNSPDLIVVDPPRAGLSDSMKKELITFHPERIVYVSCNPQTLARDLKFICDSGYEIKKAVPLNMFPMTKHIECVTMLTRRADVHNMKLHPAPFEMIKSGRKTIELRLFDKKRQQIKVGDKIIFANIATKETTIAEVLKLHRFDNFEELYRSLPLLECGYTEENAYSATPADMEKYYSKEEQSKYGVVGIEIRLL